MQLSGNIKSAKQIYHQVRFAEEKTKGNPCGYRMVSKEFWAVALPTDF